MNGVQCENGHYYDADRLGACPMCQGASTSIVKQAYDIQYASSKGEMPVNDDRFVNPNRGDFGNARNVSSNDEFARIIVVILLVCCIIYRIYAFVDLYKNAESYSGTPELALKAFFGLVSDLAIPAALLFIVRRIGRE